MLRHCWRLPYKNTRCVLLAQFMPLCPCALRQGWQSFHTCVALKKLQSMARENLRHGRQICALLVPVLLERRRAICCHAEAHPADSQLLGQCNALSISSLYMLCKYPRRQCQSAEDSIERARRCPHG